MPIGPPFAPIVLAGNTPAGADPARYSLSNAERLTRNTPRIGCHTSQRKSPGRKSYTYRSHQPPRRTQTPTLHHLPWDTEPIKQPAAMQHSANPPSPSSQPPNPTTIRPKITPIPHLRTIPKTPPPDHAPLHPLLPLLRTSTDSSTLPFSHPMPSDPTEPPTRLRIWQQNLNTSLIAQSSLLNGPHASKWDIIVIQEPYINFLRNTSASQRWHMLYPTHHYTHPLQCTHVVTLINSTIDTNAWKQIPYPSSDVILLQIASPASKCTIFNIYNDCNSQDTLTSLDTFLASNMATICPTPNDHVLWMGDFNRHHPMWEEPWNRHLINYAAAQPLIDLITTYEMVQLLPAAIPTLQSVSTGNWTRPDNVFGTEPTLNAIISCCTEPALRGPKTDHVPIHLTLDLTAPRMNSEPRRNWHEVDWDKFNEHLNSLLSMTPPHQKKPYGYRLL